MTAARSPELYKIGITANSEIIVPTTSPVYRLFYERRVVAKEILKRELIQDDLEYAMNLLESYNENIRKFFLL